MFILINDSAKSESRRPSRRSETEPPRSQSKSNQGSTARWSNVQSINHGTDQVDDDEHMSRGIILVLGWV